MMDLSLIPFEQVPAASSLSPEALQFLPGNATVAQALKVLQKKYLAHEAIPVLDDAMPEREAVWWAAQSCEKAGDSLAPTDLEAEKAGFTGPGAFAAQAATFAESPPVLAAGDPLGAAMAGQSGAAAAGGAAAAAGDDAPALAPGDAIGTSLAKQTAAGAVRLAALQGAGLLPAAVTPELVGAGAAAATAVAAAAASQDSGDSDETETSSDAPESEPVSRKERKQVSKASAPYLDLGKDVAAGKNHW